MPKLQKVFKLFIASPGDLMEEREAAETAITEVNLLLSDALDARLELVRWEKNVRPGIGMDAQDVVNQQLGDNYDIFVGLMWGRFGTPTGRAESGTEEEFNLALARWRADPKSVEIMFYFKDVAIPPSQIDPAQLTKVQEFKCRFMNEGGLSFSLDGVDDFKSKLRMHLSSLLREMSERPYVVSATEAGSPISVAVLKHFSALTDEDFDEGFIELSEQANEAMVALVPVTEKMGNAITSIGDKIRYRTESLQALKIPSGSVSREDAKRIVNASAEDIEEFVGKLAQIIPEYQRKQTQAFDLFGRVVVIANADFSEPLEDVEEVLNSVVTLKNTMLVSASQTAGFRDTIAGLPRMTTLFNRARRRAVALLDDLIAEIDSGSAQAEDVERLLRLRIEKKSEPKD